MVVLSIALCLGSAHRALGGLAFTLGEDERAARHYELALEADARIGAELWLAHTRVDYARLLVRQGETGRARALLDQALETAGRLGLVALAERAHPLRDQGACSP